MFTTDYVSGCAPLTVQFNNLSQTGGGTFLWNFGNNDTTSTVFNPVRTFPNPGTYPVLLYVKNSSSCNVNDTAMHYVTVYPSINADFNYVSTPCTNFVEFSDSSAASPIAWFWQFGDGDTSFVQNPTHIYNAAGNYNVQLITANQYLCMDTIDMPVAFPGNPVTVNASTSICRNLSTQLNATGGYAYSWSPAAGLSNTTISNPVANPSVTTTYTVVIHSMPALGDTCIQVLTTTVSVYSPLNFPLSATADHDTISQGTSTILHAITDTTLTVHWSPETGLNNANSFHPSVSPTVTTTYTVTMTDPAGCPKTASVTIYVISLQCNPDDVFVPNTFTPNGDGKNDILFVRSNSISEIYFAVYNRWGEMVFETSDIKKGWDGIFKGEPANPDVFAWYLTAKCYNKEEMKKKGNVTLVR